MADNHLEVARDWLARSSVAQNQSYLEKAVWRILRHLEEQEKQAVKSEQVNWTQRWQEIRETALSLPDTAQPEENQRGSDISSGTFYLAKAGQHGELRITGTATFRVLNSTQILGGELSGWLEPVSIPLTPSTLASLLGAGQQQQVTPEGLEGGLHAGGLAKSRDDKEVRVREPYGGEWQPGGRD